MNLDLKHLTSPHGIFSSRIKWHLLPTGLSIDGARPEGTPGEPATVRRVLNDFGREIRYFANLFQVPVELIVATICTESGGRPGASREEPGYVSDTHTPHRVSVGLMQTLISTARSATGANFLTRERLIDPGYSIWAGTKYILQQHPMTDFDPPVVACAYNAGNVYKNDGELNPWNMRQFPIGTGKHADRFVKWFNDCFTVFEGMVRSGGSIPRASFYRALRDG